jgi:very-short-patch-repair endonuclease
VSERWRSGNGGRNENAKVRVSRLAARQFGRVSTDQLARIGVSRPTIGRWTDAGYLHPVLPAVYAVGHRARSVEGDLAAGLLYVGPGAMLSHATAAWWFDLIDRRPSTTEISTARRCVSLPDIRVHDRREVHRTWHDRLPVTEVAQALLDYAATAPVDRIRRALAEAEYLDLLDLEAVECVLGRGRPGSRVLRQALKRHEPAYAHTRSELENALLALCERHCLPIPAINVMVEGWLVDAVWFDRRVVVEVDGHRGHRTPAQLQRDHTRDLQLRAAGFTVVRYTWAQVTTQAGIVAADLRGLLGLGRAGA